MNVLVCVKRVPAPGAKIVLTPDGRDIDTRHLGFTVSPHEECAVEEAVQLVERHGGSSCVLTVGPPEADEQLRYAMAMGVSNGVLVEAAEPWDPQATAAAIVDAVGQLGADGMTFDLILFGNESADAGNYQVGVRVAHALGLPFVAGIKGIEVGDGTVTLRRATPAGFERYELPLPAAVAVKEGINLPRYPPVTGRLKAKKAQVRTFQPAPQPGGLELVALRHPPQQETETVLLGAGADAAPRAADMLTELGLL
jgi:electron transfer flavoprotein beta subunit